MGYYVLTQLERVENSPHIYVLLHMPSCFPPMSSPVLSSQPISHTSNSRLFVLIIVFWSLSMSYTILSHLFPYMLSLAVSLKCVIDVLVSTVSLTSLSVRPAAHEHRDILPHRHPTVPNLTSPCHPPLRATSACLHTHIHILIYIRIHIPLVFSALTN